VLLHIRRGQEDNNFKRFLELSIICYDNGWNFLDLGEKVTLIESGANLLKSLNLVSDKETVDTEELSSDQSKLTSNSRRKKKVKQLS
jgi:hypothetical protein